MIQKINIPILATLFFILPSVSFAVTLTQQQSTSLIAVVQSSPGTPASAFVSLITAFSNITVSQATSLISVVQAAPGVPASVFVDLLTSFTVDTQITQSPSSTVPVTDVCSNIEGIQTAIPGGMTATGNVCMTIPVSSTTNPPPLSPYTISVNVEFGTTLAADYIPFVPNSTQLPVYNARMSINEPFDKAIFYYYATDHRNEGDTWMDFSQDRVIGTLWPNTNYTWVVKATKGTQTTEATGTFTTGDYQMPLGDQRPW